MVGKEKEQKKPGGISISANQQMPWGTNQIQHYKYKSIHLMQYGTKKLHWHWATETRQVSVPHLCSDWPLASLYLPFQLKRKQNLAYRSDSCFKLLSSIIYNYCNLKSDVSPSDTSCLLHLSHPLVCGQGSRQLHPLYGTVVLHLFL